MKKQIFILTSCLLGALALALPSCSARPDFEEVVEEKLEDPISYSEVDKVVSIDNPYMVRRDGSDDEKIVRPNILRLHYHNDDNACLNRRFYTWVTGVDGVERKPNLGEWNATDMAIEIDFTSEEYADYADSSSLYFIIKVAGTWAGQSEDTQLTYSDWTIENDVLEVWTIPGEGTSIEIYETEEETKLPKIQTAKFTDFQTILCTCTIDTNGKAWVPTEYKLYAFDKSYLASTEASQAANKQFYLFKTGNPTTNKFEIKFNYTAKINVQYVIESRFPGFDRTQKVIVSYENLYNSDRFNEFYNYAGDDLGMTYTAEGTTFKVWSPISAFATVNIYDTGTPRSLGGSDACDVYRMGYSKGGVWETTIKGDLRGKYYTFTLTNSGGTQETMDPYAKACGINGLRAFVYDKASADANPDGWDTVPAKWDGVTGYDIATPQDLSIYEIHIRDLTMDETWVSSKTPATQRGTFAAFSESGTTYTASGKTVKTGFDHIEELGVKAIQLVPVFDHDDDERPEKMKFNWGYNPLNYNCIEGGYSSDPTDPLARIKEYKGLIKAYSENENHTRVIMDVVYNHVSSASSSCFTKTMPKYYFRYDAEWNYMDGSGCSNEVKTDAPMMRKYVVDSLKWWATEYKIKGFRFDLMGLIDTLTLKYAKEALYEIDPDIYIYGEGWTSGGYHGENRDIPVQDPARDNTFHIGGASNDLIYSQLWESSASKGIVGGFNNAGRDNLKGGNDDGFNGNPYPTWGFISQGSGDIGNKSTEVSNLLKGINSWAPGANPRQTVSYASCHDNYTLWDQLQYTLAGSYNGDHSPNSPIAVKDAVMASLATHAVVFAANTASFIQGGEELYRTKSYKYCSAEEWAKLTEGGADATVRPFPDNVHYSTDPDVIQATSDVRMFSNGHDQNVVTHNSYKSPDAVNSFKWDRKIAVDGTSTYEYIGIWQTMIKEHSKMAKVDYPVNLDTPTFNVWGVGDNSTSLALWNGNEAGTSGYFFFVTGREGGSIGFGGFDGVTILFSTTGTQSMDGYNLKLPPFTAVLAKK